MFLKQEPVIFSILLYKLKCVLCISAINLNPVYITPNTTSNGKQHVIVKNKSLLNCFLFCHRLYVKGNVIMTNNICKHLVDMCKSYGTAQTLLCKYLILDSVLHSTDIAEYGTYSCVYKIK